MIISTHFELHWRERDKLKSLYDSIKELNLSDYYNFQNTSHYKCKIISCKTDKFLNETVYINLDNLKWDEVDFFYFDETGEFNEYSFNSSEIFKIELIRKETHQIKKILNLRKEGLECL